MKRILKSINNKKRKYYKVGILKDKLGIYGFEYPQSFIKALELNLLNFDLWYIMNEEMTIDRLNGIRER